jgi:kinesin family protein 2/24
LELLKDKHEDLVNKILCEEDELLTSHRKFIDDTVDLVKKEMVLLHDVDKPGSDVEEYINSLDAILCHKQDMVDVLRSRLSNFKKNI